MNPARLSEDATRVEEWLDRRMGSPDGAAAPRLVEAMRYSLLGGGKRLRPVLCLWVHDAASTDRGQAVWHAAAALECLHTYSLIHDDLPAMDDDDLRRGRPSCHRQFDEATAILAGDTLQTEAFGILADIDDPEVSRDLARELARASGVGGMAAGQQLDLQAAADLGSMEEIHRRKTGCLLGASITMGARCAGIVGTPLDRLREAGVQLGIAFQIVDDVLDATGDATRLGKSTGKDAVQGKLTALGTMTVEQAWREARVRLQTALTVLEEEGVLSEGVREIATMLVERDR